MFAAFLGLKTNGGWHIWLGLVLVLSAIGAVAGLIAGYLKKVVLPQYRGPKK
jgi:hypothetical protein